MSYGWKDNIKMNLKEMDYEGVEWIYLPQDRNLSVAVVNCNLFKLPLSKQFSTMLRWAVDHITELLFSTSNIILALLQRWRLYLVSGCTSVRHLQSVVHLASSDFSFISC
jgi:hypothetical protein